MLSETETMKSIFKKVELANIQEFNEFIRKHPKVKYLDVILGDLSGIIRGKRIPINDADKIIIKKDEEFFNALEFTYNFLNSIRAFKKFGTAILKLIYQNILASVIINQKYYNKLNYNEIIDNSLTSNLIPLLENLPLTELEMLHSLYSQKTTTFLKDVHDNGNIESYEKAIFSLCDLLELQKDEIFEKLVTMPQSQLEETWKQIDEKIPSIIQVQDYEIKNVRRAITELMDSTII